MTLHICDLNNFYSKTGGGVRTYHEHKKTYFRTQRPDAQYTLFIPDEFEREEVDHNVRVVSLPATPIPGATHYRYIFSPHALRRHLERLQPDILEVGSPYIAPWVARAATRDLPSCRVIGFWHADYPRAYFKRYVAEVHPRLGDLAHDVGWWYARSTYGQYDATFAAADCVVDELVERGIPRVFQTPLGVDTERFHPQWRDDALRTSVGANANRPILFFPHRLIEEKGLSTLLAAYDRIAQEHDPILVFAGIGPGLAKLETFMEGRDDVHYLGYVSDPKQMAAWYASADAVFALSAFETFGLSAAEAMASGNPLIAANQGAAAELVERSGTGVLVPYGDVEKLIEQTNALLDLDLQEQGVRARTFAAKHFNWNTAFDRFMECYEEVHRAGGRENMSDAPRRWVTSSV